MIIYKILYFAKTKKNIFFQPQASRPRTVTRKKGKKVSKLFKAARKLEEILVFLDPPEEKAEGDTDRDSGIFVQNDQAFFIPNFLLLTFF